MIIEILLVNLLALNVNSLVWHKLLSWDPAPSPRMKAAIGFHSKTDCIIMFGGKDSSGVLADTWIYDRPNGTWTELNTSHKPPARFDSVYGVSNGYFYVATGQGPTQQHYNDVWRFNFTNLMWEELTSRRGSSRQSYSLEGRYGSAGGIYPGSSRLYLTMGLADRLIYQTVYYDVRRSRWYEDYPCEVCNSYNPAYPHARYFHSAAMTSPDELVIYGGCLSGGSAGGPCPSGDSWIYSGVTKNWTRLSACITPRLNSGMAALPGHDGQRKVVLYGGKVDSKQVIKTEKLRVDELAVLDLESRTWTRRRTKSKHGNEYPKVRHSMSITSGSDGVFIYGGVCDKEMNFLDDLWFLEAKGISADKPEVLVCDQKWFFSLPMVHGILMTIGWGFFLLWGAFVARFMKSKEPYWFYIHVSFQIFGLSCAVAGLVIAVLSVRLNHFNFIHGILGMITMIIGILQPINAIFRPHAIDPAFYKSWARRVWEWIHHFSGGVSLVLAMINISLGVFLILSPLVIWSLWFAYLSLVIVAIIVAELFCRYRRLTHVADDGEYVKAFEANGAHNVAVTKYPPSVTGYYNQALATESSHL